MSESAEKKIINLRLDAGKGSSSKLAKDVTVGLPVGEMPRAVCRGKEFLGWFTSPTGGEKVGSDTVAAWETDVTLYARYARSAVRRRTAFRTQAKALCILVAVVAVLAVAAYLVLNFVSDVYDVTDPADGSVYYTRKVWDTAAEARIYQLTYKDGTLLPVVDYSTETTEYSFYETDAGTWFTVDPDTGKASVYAVVDVDGEERVGFHDRVLLYPSISQSDTYSIEVTNDYGTYTVNFDADGNVFFNGQGGLVVGNAEMIASLCSACGYPLSAMRIDSPIKDADGSFTSEYGLDGKTRFTVTRAATDKSGNFVASKESYTVYVGNALVSGGGYYVQLEGRDKVYIYSIAGASSAMYHPLNETVLAPVEDLISPAVTYPMSSSTYYDVLEFALMRTEDGYFDTEDNDDLLKLITEFSYVQMWERSGTLHTTDIYVSDMEDLRSYRVHADNASAALQKLALLAPVRCVKLDPSAEDMMQYGLANYRYILHFGMWVDMSDYFVSDNALVSGFLPNDAKVTYRDLYETTRSVAADEDGTTSYKLDILADTVVHSFVVTEGEDSYEYRTTETSQYAFYGGTWLSGDGLAAEIASDKYTYYKEYGCDVRYDVTAKKYYFRMRGHVYAGTDAVRVTDSDTVAAVAERLLINDVIISDRTADGTYYAYNALCSQIAEVSESDFDFLAWERLDWLDSQVYSIPIAYVTDIRVTAGEYTADITADNSASDQSDGFNSSDVVISAEDSEGKTLSGVGRYIFQCYQTGSDGKTLVTEWRVTEDDYTVYDAETGRTLRYTGYPEYTATNKYGESVKYYPLTLTCTDGSTVRVGTDTITVTKNGTVTDIPRYAVQNYRHFFMDLLYLTLEGEADLDEADPAVAESIRNAVQNGDDSVCSLVLTIRGEDTAKASGTAEENGTFAYVFRFYQYTKGKMLLTVEVKDGNTDGVGNGEEYSFYVKSSYVEKIIADTHRFFNEEFIDAEAKY